MFPESLQLSTLKTSSIMKASEVAVFGSSYCIYVHSFLKLCRIQKRRKVNKSKGRSIQTPLRPNISLASGTACFTDREFSGAFRMSKINFDLLLDRLRVDLSRNTEMGRRSNRTTISADLRLAIGLRMMAGAKARDLAGWFKIKTDTVRRIFFEVVESVVKRVGLPGLPKTVRGLHDAALAFKCSRKYPNPLNGCVGALDGIAIKIRKPREENDQKSYYNRKGFFAIPVQALCDASYRFLCFSSRCVGAIHDSLAHAVSRLGAFLEKGMLNGEFWIAGDSAYICTESLITPFPTSEADENEDAFDFFLSQMRIHIEQAFGMMVTKWSILESPLPYSIQRCTRIIGAVMCLHNWCIDGKESFKNGLEDGEWQSVYTDTVKWHRAIRAEIMNDTNLGRSIGMSAADVRAPISKKRQMLVEVVRRKGLRRPRVRGH